ncbi:MAG TPA: class I SAM-dependent methyltransferase [Anaerolineales bacterium]|nr:class I SAM-dependent methyltransferase [Anaerolineales bacterium]
MNREVSENKFENEAKEVLVVNDIQSIYNTRYAEQDGPKIEEAKRQARKFVSRCMKHVLSPAQRFSSILDLGCGNGTKTYWLKDYSDAVLGVDISQTGVSQARRVCDRQGIEYRVMDVGKDMLERRYACITSFGLSTTNLDRVEDVASLIVSYIRRYGEERTTYVYFSKTDFTGHNPGWKYYSHSELRGLLSLLHQNPEIDETKTIFFLPKDIELDYGHPVHRLALAVFQGLSRLRHHKAYRLPFITIIKACRQN